jgi:putative transposase
MMAASSRVTLSVSGSVRQPPCLIAALIAAVASASASRGRTLPLGSRTAARHRLVSCPTVAVGGKKSVRRRGHVSLRHAPAVLDWLWLLLSTLRVLLHDRRALLVENLLLRQQLAVALRANPRPRLRRRDRLFWAVALRVCVDWRRHLLLVRPETVLRWHRRGWRLYWWWRSRRPVGRPRVPGEVRDLIARMSKDNPLWGTERLRGELRKLGIAVSAGSVRRYRWRRPAKPPSQTWRTFLRNHAAQIWAADLFTVPTLTFRTLYVLFFLTHDRRELVHIRVTAHPTAAWVWRQLIEATAWGRRPRYVLRDRDAVYGRAFAAQAAALGIDTLLTPFRAPRANALAERVIRTLRQECLDHVLILNERHLQAVLEEFVAFYNTERPHRGLALEPPLLCGTARPAPPGPPGRVVARPILGGLHHVYQRAA